MSLRARWGGLLSYRPTFHLSDHQEVTILGSNPFSMWVMVSG